MTGCTRKSAAGGIPIGPRPPATSQTPCGPAGTARGDQLPSLVTLAAGNQTHRGPCHAMRRLRELGYVTYRRGHGYFVGTVPPSRE